MKRFMRATLILLMAAALSLPFASTSHAAMGQHFHPTRKATATPHFKIAGLATVGACSLYYVNSTSTPSNNGWWSYTELDGAYDGAGNFCGYFYGYSKIYQPPHQPVDGLIASLCNTIAPCTDTVVWVATNVNGQYWDTFSPPLSGPNGTQYYACTSYNVAGINSCTARAYP